MKWVAGSDHFRGVASRLVLEVQLRFVDAHAAGALAGVFGPDSVTWGRRGSPGDEPDDASWRR
jgi:hypothetical protein